MRWRLSLYQRLAMSLVVVFGILLSVFIWGSERLHDRTKQAAEQRLHLQLAEHLVHDNPLLAQGLYDQQALENLFHTLMLLGPSFEFYYLNSAGRILAYSAPPGKVVRNTVDLTPLKALLARNVGLPVVGDDPRNTEGQKIFSVAPVYRGEALQGYLYMIIGGQSYDSVLAATKANQVNRDLVMVVVGSLLFLLIVLLVLFRAFTAPLRRLTGDIHRLQQGGFSNADIGQWPADSSSEISQLGRAFQDMLEHIQQQFEQLQQLDRQRRVLLTDLSHDLRTPLTNLQGYIETLALNGQTMSDEQRQRFTAVSLKHAQNLKLLIDQIFELAYLDSGQVTVHQESFPLGDLLHDVVAKFTLSAEQNKIHLQVSPSKFDYQVFADIGKLERVLTNLIENAFRHTPSGGQIDIQVASVDEQRLRIDLRDTGMGISEQEIGLIFNARYQASNSQPGQGQHNGLGLAISKKLMALLGTDLTVRSELGKGTCFSFELQRVPG